MTPFLELALGLFFVVAIFGSFMALVVSSQRSHRKLVNSIRQLTEQAPTTSQPERGE